ncbi:MAG: hypothetical protein ACR2N3_04445 [Pyrinomonadaceae bacterium]
MNKNFGDISKIGEKMVEISGAYAQINTFLNELQTVINRNQYGYYPSQSGYDPYSSYNPYNSSYNPYSGQSSYGSSYNYNSPYGYSSPYGSQPGIYNQTPAWLDLAVERLAKSFNIQMPSCWYANNQYNSQYNSYNPYNTYTGGTTSTGSSYTSSYYGSGSPTPATGSGSYAPGSGGLDRNDFVARSQCVARAVNPQDFDISVTRMWQQGGVFLVAELQKKYPQLAFYINVAAVAIDFIVRAFQKSPVRIVPTIISTNITANTSNYQNYPVNTTASSYTSSYYQSQNFQSDPNQTVTASTNAPPADSKISLYSNTPPSNQGYLTTYPIVVEKWQAEPDAEIVRLNTPALSEACLHTGLNLLKNTNLTDDWTGDNFTRDFKLVVTSDNGFRKEFPLRKNLGLGGWELNLTPPDAAQIPKIAMSLEGEIVGMRGFNEVRSEKFKLPVAGSSKWEMVPATQADFAVGGKKRIALRNTIGDCLCVQSVTYKPGFGGQFTFDRSGGENSLQVSPDNLSVWFEVETSKFQPGQGTLEVKTYGGEIVPIPLKLYPALPEIKDVRVARGDRQILLTGERLEQLRYVVVNGYRATIQPNTFAPPDSDNPQLSTKLAIFDDPRIKQTGATASLELGLEDERRFSYPQNFTILPARPAISADEKMEVEGISDVFLVMRDNLPVKNKRNVRNDVAKDSFSPGGSIVNQLIASHTSMFPIDTKEISLSVQNNLNDYEFKSENISIETRVEKSQTVAGDYIKTASEVLDSNVMRIKFFLYNDTHTNLGGRRVQFRIHDRERGDSDWYTIKQTFVRLPQILSVKCASEMNGMCEMKGDGMDYVGQVSVDGGKTWYQGDKGTLQAQPTVDGKSMVMIPQLINKKLLQIKLRDFPETNGLVVNNLNFTNSVKSGIPATKVNSK